jgi:OOP family OmpA-OmpF porin
MRGSRVILAVGVMLLCLAIGSNAMAEMQAGDISVTPFVGLYVFEGNQNLEESPMFGLGLGYQLDEHWGLEGVFAYIDADAKDDVAVTRDILDPPWTETDYRDPNHVDVCTYRLDALYHFMGFGSLVPYLAAGVGGITINDDLIEDDGTSFLVNYGGGVKFFLNESWALRADVRHVIPFDDTYNNLAATVGVTYVIGAKPATPCKDSDADGICDDDDNCPDTPAGVAVDQKGCPMDSDMDGVADYRDKCPGTPRGVRVDLDGCPMDSDGDGVPDYLDKCPGTPKGVAVDSDGCPKDSDGDGIPDYRDKCPDTPKGVVVDSDGCPIDSDGDGVPDYRDKCPGTPLGAPVNDVGCWIIKEVEFDFNKADVKPKYFGRLDEAVGVMKKNPSMSVEIQGHTDSVGSDEFNQKLSERRAQSVMEYFIGQGIAKNRLTAVGFGESKPVASNETDAGRAKNRRVQLKPIY